MRVSTKDPNIDPATLEMWRRRVNADYETAMQPLWDFVARCPVQPWWGGRDAFMFDGPVAAVAAIVSPGGQRLPQWWWPHDRSWFVGNEVDYNWIYVAGSRFAIDALGGIAGLESIEVEFSDRW